VGKMAGSGQNVANRKLEAKDRKQEVVGKGSRY
jgi:hypothetical protein